MNRREKECMRYFDQAAVDLMQNPYLPPYLLGMAQAWRLAGTIDERTHEDMVRTARKILMEAGR